MKKNKSINIKNTKKKRKKNQNQNQNPWENEVEENYYGWTQTEWPGLGLIHKSKIYFNNQPSNLPWVAM